MAVTLTVSHGGEVRFYLGTNTRNTSSEGIYTGLLDTETGSVGSLKLAAKAANPSFLAITPDGKHLVSVMETAGGAVTSFRITTDGSLESVNEQASGGNGPCHVSTDQAGRHVFVANYGGGNIACLPIAPDGTLTAATSQIPFTGSGPDPKRQSKSFAHAIGSDPSDRFVYACDLGADRVWSFQFDPETGAMHPTDPPAGKVPPGGGPRHFVLSNDGRFLYANNEMGLSVTAFARHPDSGTLEAMQTVPLGDGPAGPKPGVTSAEIVLHPSGKWLYVSSRGDDTLSQYSIADDGTLTRVETVPAAVAIPRGMGLDPTARWLLVGGQEDNRLAVHRVDPETGKLTLNAPPVETPSPICVVFVP